MIYFLIMPESISIVYCQRPSYSQALNPILFNILSPTQKKYVRINTTVQNTFSRISRRKYFSDDRYNLTFLFPAEHLPCSPDSFLSLLPIHSLYGPHGFSHKNPILRLSSYPSQTTAPVRQSPLFGSSLQVRDRQNSHTGSPLSHSSALLLILRNLILRPNIFIKYFFLFPGNHPQCLTNLPGNIHFSTARFFYNINNPNAKNIIDPCIQL